MPGREKRDGIAGDRRGGTARLGKTLKESRGGKTGRPAQVPSNSGNGEKERYFIKGFAPLKKFTDVEWAKSLDQ